MNISARKSVKKSFNLEILYIYFELLENLKKNKEMYLKVELEVVRITQKHFYDKIARMFRFSIMLITDKTFRVTFYVISLGRVVLDNPLK